MTREETVTLFVDNAEKCAATVLRAADLDELNAALKNIAGPGLKIYCPGITELERSFALPSDALTDDPVNADACVQEVPAAVAETGSIISTSNGGKPVQAGLLPSHHVAVVTSSNIHESLDDLFALHREDTPTNITMETGPSRTADIELTLTIGVHGPERLTIIVLDR